MSSGSEGTPSWTTLCATAIERMYALTQTTCSASGDRADGADAAWLERVRANVPAPLQIPSLVELYDLVYDGYANLDHPSVTALQVFVHTDTARSEIVVDGAPERDWEADMRPYWLAAWSFVWALMVSSLATGRPRLGPLNERISRDPRDPRV